MADVINRITKQYLRSVNTPDYPVKDWIINPILPNCSSSEWVIEGNLIRETTQAEKDAKEAEKLAEEQAKKNKEITDKLKEDADKIKARENFMSLTIGEKFEYLYDNRM